jgi:probable HAF family extracellular repeat protein
MRSATIRFCVLAITLLSVLPLGAATLVTGPEDLGNLGGSMFPCSVSGVGRNGTLAGGAERSSQVNVPIVWTSATGIKVIGTEPGYASAANGVGQVVGILRPENDLAKAFLWSPSPAPEGTITIISSPVATDITPQAINDLGQVAGVAYFTNSGEQHVFLWSQAGGFKDLGWLGGYVLAVNDITENGLVVGEARLANGDSHAFQSRNGGTIKDLGTLGGTLAIATAANDAGVVVGYSRGADGNTHAFMYSKGKMTALPSTSPESFAYGINASGMIVGGGGTYGVNKAMVWSPAGVPQEIEGASIAVAVNDNGMVAMTSGLGYQETPRAHLWSAGTFVLGGPHEDDYNSQATGVTADGRLVALRQDWSGVNKVVVWNSAIDRTLLDGVGGGYSRALYVNASGKIAGFSRTVKGYDRAFLWTPNATGGGSMVEIPGPAGWSTAPVGLNASGAVAGVSYHYIPWAHEYTSGSSFYWPGSGPDYANLGQVTAVDLNDVGQILGYELHDLGYGQYQTSSFVWKGGFEQVPSIGTGNVIPADINNLGQVVGRFNVDPWNIHAFSWKSGTSPVDLGTLGGTYSEAVAVNDAGQIAGNSALADPLVTHAFRTTATAKKMTDLGALAQDGQSVASAMNKNGVVVGIASSNGSVFRVFLYDTRMKDLGEGDNNFRPAAINDFKDVVGSRLAPPTYGPHGYVSLGGAPIVDLPDFALPVISGENWRAFGINGAGVAVGDALLATGEQKAVRWRTK